MYTPLPVPTFNPSDAVSANEIMYDLVDDVFYKIYLFLDSIPVWASQGVSFFDVLCTLILITVSFFIMFRFVGQGNFVSVLRDKK